MAIKPIRPGVEVPEPRTPPDVLAFIDELHRAAHEGVVPSVAIVYDCCGMWEFAFATDEGLVQLSGAAHELARKVSQEAFDVE